MPVSETHTEYDKNLNKWELTRNAATGLSFEEARDYIPRRTHEEQDQYYQRVEKAIYTNYTGRTREGLKGAIFRLPPRIELPPDMEFMLDNADGAGQSLTQVAKLAADELMETGRFGLLADYPMVDEELTVEQVRRMGLQPHIATYTAESIINWHVHVINGRRQLGMLVLKENSPIHYDEFTWDYVDRYRVLRLKDNREYTQQLYDENCDPLTEEIAVRGANGKPFDYIPFQFIGSRDNLPAIDEPILYDIARVNIGHFRNSADQENNLSVHGGGTLVVSTDMSPEAFQSANPGGITVGENSGLILSEGGKAELLQLDAAGAIGTEMTHKEQMMVQIGAKIITKTGQRTAEEARIQATSENSMLDTMVGNMNEAFTKVLYDCRAFISATDADIVFSLNDDFWQDSIAATEIMAMIQGNDAGVMPKIDIVRRLMDAGWIQSEGTAEDILSDITQESPI
tara:strand:+ start:507 stop:1877 length:1371 start_codon:yes stop_codon:yes gene_type:complete